MTDVTAYLCCRRLPALSVVSPSSAAITASNKVVTVRMVSEEGCATDHWQVIAKLERVPILNSRSVYTCTSPGGTYLTIRYIQYDGDTIVREYPEFVAKNGEHCHWFATQVLGNGPPRCVGYGCLFAETTANSGGGYIPDDKDDVFPNLGAENVHQMTDNQISPGMLVSVRHYFYNGIDTVTDVADSEYYTTNTFTGGTILAINGAYGDADITYDVSIEGSTVECRPSDWVDRNIGDWVIVLKESSTIVPLRIGVDVG